MLDYLCFPRNQATLRLPALENTQSLKFEQCLHKNRGLGRISLTVCPYPFLFGFLGRSHLGLLRTGARNARPPPPPPPPKKHTRLAQLSLKMLSSSLRSSSPSSKTWRWGSAPAPPPPPPSPGDIGGKQASSQGPGQRDRKKKGFRLARTIKCVASNSSRLLGPI